MARYKIIGPVWLHFEDSGPRLLLPDTEVRHDDGKIERVDTVVEYDGWPSAAAMEPLDDEAFEAAEAVSRLKSTGALPATPALWRERTGRERAQRRERETSDAG